PRTFMALVDGLQSGRRSRTTKIPARPRAPRQHDNKPRSDPDLESSLVEVDPGGFGGVSSLLTSRRDDLHELVKDGKNRDKIEEIIQQRVDLNKVRYGKPALAVAVECNLDDICKLRIENRADVNIADDRGWSALAIAVDSDCDQYNICWLLIENRADVNADVGKTQLLNMAVARNDEKMVDALALARAQVDRVAGDNKTALHLAAEAGNHLIAKCLLDRRANPNTVTASKMTALHYAAKHGHESVADELLDHGANVDDTAEGNAAEKAHWDVLEMLLKKKACDADLAAEEVLSLFFQKQLQKKTLTKHLFVSWIKAEAPEAVMLLHMWPQVSKQYDPSRQRSVPVKRSNLTQHERLRVVLASAIEDGAEVVRKTDVDLANQNLFNSPEKRTTLKVLPGLTGKDAFSILKYLVHTKNLAIFETDAVEAVVLAAWQQARADTFEIGCCLVLVLLLCYATYVSQNASDWKGDALPLYGSFIARRPPKRLFSHCGRLWRRFWHQTWLLLDFDNLADLVYLSFGWVAMCKWHEDSGTREYKPFMGIFAAMVWLRAVYSPRGESWLGPNLLPVLAAVRESNGFLFVISVCTLAATHAHYDLETTWQDSNQPWPLYVSFMRVMRLAFLGDFDLFEFEGLDVSYQRINESQSPGQNWVLTHGLFYVISWGITILLMNILIAVISESYTRYRTERSTLLLQARAKMVLELSNRPWRCLATSVFLKSGSRDDPSQQTDGEVQGSAQNQGREGFEGVQPTGTESHREEAKDAKAKVTVRPGGATECSCSCSFLGVAMKISMFPFLLYHLPAFRENGAKQLLCYLEHQQKQYRCRRVLPVLLPFSAPFVWVGFILFFLSQLVVRYQGILHVIATSIGWHGAQSFVPASDCQIWLLLDSSGSQKTVDLHKDLKGELQDMKRQMSALQVSLNKLRLEVGATPAKCDVRASTGTIRTRTGRTLTSTGHSDRTSNNPASCSK
ncbi:ANK3, partial [Symbiodinium sp. CCMP2456]